MIKSTLQFSGRPPLCRFTFSYHHGPDLDRVDRGPDEGLGWRVLEKNVERDGKKRDGR